MQSSSGTGTYIAEVYLSTDTAPPEAHAPSDYYALQLAAGQRASLVAAALTPGQISLALEDAAGSLRAAGALGAGGAAQVIGEFVAPAAGTYYARVTGRPNLRYSLVVPRGAAFDTEPNDSAAAAQDLTPTGIALGSDGPGAAGDYYRFQLSAGDEAHFSTRTPGDGPPLALNRLDPVLELYPPGGGGVPLASDDNGADDGRNADLLIRAKQSGQYVARVRATGATGGSYVLEAHVHEVGIATIAAEPPATGGTANTISWTAVVGANEYYAQCDSDETFASPERASGWTTATSYTFTDLTPGVTYYYRVKARNRTPGPTASIEQTAQAEFRADVLESADAAASLGDVLLARTPQTQFAEDFEDGNRDGWVNGAGTYTRSVTNQTAGSGSYSLTLTGGASRHYDGVSHALADLRPDRVALRVRAASRSANAAYFVLGSGPTTAQTAVLFYARGDGTMGLTAAAGWYGTPYNANQWYAVALAFNWAARTVDYFVDGRLVAANVPFRGTGVNALGVAYLYNYTPAQAWWDDIVFQSNTGGYAPTGSVLWRPAVSGPFAGWGTLAFDADVPAQTRLAVDVLDAAGAVLATDVATGTDLGALGIQSPSLALRARLNSDAPAASPVLHAWSVTWRTAPDLVSEGQWSAVVRSAQA